MSNYTEKRTLHTCAIGNLGHNPSATTAHTSFHGTGLSVLQHHSQNKKGEARCMIPTITTGTKSKNFPSLPEYYTHVPPAHFKQDNPIPTSSKGVGHQQLVLSKQMSIEYEWLEKFTLSNNSDTDITVSWAAHHASQKRQPCFEVSLSPMLPLFKESAHSVAMMKHAMDIAKSTTSFLNLGQTPVIAADQPNSIQLQWPSQYGDLFSMFGGLHLEMAAFKVLGDLLKDGGCTGALAEAEIASPGRAYSFLSVSHVKKTCRAYQVTACSLYQLRKAADVAHIQDVAEENEQSSDQWVTKREAKSRQFYVWNLVLQLEFLVFLYIRSQPGVKFPTVQRCDT